MPQSAPDTAPDSPLVNLVVDESRAALLKQIAASLPDITLSERHLCDLELLATGAFSPLQGFMTRADYEPVLDRMRLQRRARCGRFRSASTSRRSRRATSRPGSRSACGTRRGSCWR